MSLRRALHKLATDPLTSVRSLWRKGVVEPRRYGTPAGDYDARRYWSNRFARYNESLRGPGDEGVSDEQNLREYQAAGEQFMRLCRSLPIDYAAANVLEIGPGSGYYTQLLRGLGVRRYTGLDIAASLLPTLDRQFAEYSFVQADVLRLPLAAQPAGAGYDLIAIIDVIEHIVERAALAAALGGLAAQLAPGGRLLLAPLMEASRRHLFYVHFWSQQDVLDCTPGLHLEASAAFRQGQLVSLQRPPHAA